MGYLSQMWVGGVADSQTRFKPLKTPPNHPENRLFRPKFHLSFSQISQKPWDGWVGKQIWERFPKKNGIFFIPSLRIDRFQEAFTPHHKVSKNFTRLYPPYPRHYATLSLCHILYVPSIIVKLY